MSLKIGQKDNLGYTIKYIHTQGPDYTIYEIENGSIMYEITNPELSQIMSGFDSAYLTIKGLIVNSPSLKRVAKDACIRALSLIAAGNHNGAKEIMKDAERRILRIRNMAGRLNYLFSCIVIVLATVTATAIISGLPKVNADFIFYAWLITFGSLGGFLSVALNLNKLEIDRDAPWQINVISGISRILIGMIGAVFVYILIKSNLLFGIIAQSDSPYAILAIAILGGFSETLVPNILRKIETKQISSVDQ